MTRREIVAAASISLSIIPIAWSGGREEEEERRRGRRHLGKFEYYFDYRKSKIDPIASAISSGVR
jgi:hypothetical protein